MIHNICQDQSSVEDNKDIMDKRSDKKDKKKDSILNSSRINNDEQ